MRLTKRGTEIITQRGQGQRITVATNQPGKKPKRARAGLRRREITPTKACGLKRCTLPSRGFHYAVPLFLVRKPPPHMQLGTIEQLQHHKGGDSRDSIQLPPAAAEAVAKTGAVAAATAATAAALALAAAVEEFAATARARVATSTATAVARWTGETCPGQRRRGHFAAEGADVPCQAERSKPARGCGDRLPDTLGDLCRAASARLPSQVLARSKDRAELGTTTGRYRRYTASTNGTAGVWTVGS